MHRANELFHFGHELRGEYLFHILIFELLVLVNITVINIWVHWSTENDWYDIGTDSFFLRVNFFALVIDVFDILVHINLAFDTFKLCSSCLPTFEDYFNVAETLSFYQIWPISAWNLPIWGICHDLITWV